MTLKEYCELARRPEIRAMRDRQMELLDEARKSVATWAEFNWTEWDAIEKHLNDLGLGKVHLRAILEGEHNKPN